MSRYGASSSYLRPTAHRFYQSARPCVSHRFNRCQRRRALTVECLSTPIHTLRLWTPWFLMRLASADSLPTPEVARRLGTSPSPVQTFHHLLLFLKPRSVIFMCTLTALRMFGTSNEWQSVSKGSECPMNHDRVLSIRNNGEPSWVTRESHLRSQSRATYHPAVMQQQL